MIEPVLNIPRIPKNTLIVITTPKIMLMYSCGAFCNSTFCRFCINSENVKTKDTKR